MTIDEMISWIDVNGKNFTADNISPEAQAIIAALRAGQEMREGFEIVLDHHPEDYFTYDIEVYKGQLLKGGQAWEAATGGGR